jgi:hypothetical protein
MEFVRRASGCCLKKGLRPGGERPAWRRSPRQRVAVASCRQAQVGVPRWPNPRKSLISMIIPVNSVFYFVEHALSHADGLGSAGSPRGGPLSCYSYFLARRLRRLAKGIIHLEGAAQKVSRFESEAGRRDADWRRSRRSRSHFLTACLRRLRQVRPVSSRENSSRSRPIQWNSGKFR